MATLRLAMIFVKDLERMTAFYRDALELQELPELAQDGRVELAAGGARIFLHAIPPSTPSTPSTPRASSSRRRRAPGSRQ